MTRANRNRARKVADIMRNWRFLHKPTAAEKTFRINELWNNLLDKADVMDLLSYREADAVATQEADGEMRRRLHAFVAGVVGEGHTEVMLEIMQRRNLGFAGYEVLKMMVPTCKEHTSPVRRIYTLFTPLGEFMSVKDHFSIIGFRLAQVNGDTLEHPRTQYGNTIADFACLRSPHGDVFVDLIESVNSIPFFPCFRMATTLHMNCLLSDYLFAPYGSLSCQRKGVINPIHGTGEHLLTLRPDIYNVVEELRMKCNVQIHRNPRTIAPHEGRCGMDPNCLHTMRTTASPGSVIYPFLRKQIDNDKFLQFLPREGVIWRLGGWSCYPSEMWGLEPVLGLVPEMHTIFDGQSTLDELADNEALFCVLGWD